jgi:hypothetical protein
MKFTARTSLVLVTLGSEGVFYAFKNDSAAMECGFDAALAGQAMYISKEEYGTQDSCPCF